MRPAELLLALALVAPPSSAQDGWSVVEPGIELAYPRDHGSHPEYRTEWWYVTGRLQSSEGRRFGYQLTVFRSGMHRGVPGDEASPLRATQAFAGHLAVTDEASGRTLLAERLRRAGSPLARASERDLDVVLEDWSLVRGSPGLDSNAEEVISLRAGDAGIEAALDLELRPEKGLVLHGIDGYSQKGDEVGNASAYASWTRLLTRGELRLEGRSFTVEGSSWFDHEFGTSSLGEGVVGWDWFGLQLDDGRELMLFQLRAEDGTAERLEGTLIAGSGEPRPLATDDLHLGVTGTWESPRTGTRYPSGWTIAVPAEGIEIRVRPWVPDAELLTGQSTDVVYWEGPVSVEGSVTGGGYAELTGYAGSMKGRL